LPYFHRLKLPVHSTVADIVHFPYVAGAKSAGIQIEQFSALQYWYMRMLRRPAITKGLEMLSQYEPGHSDDTRRVI
jgi:glutathione S-transferase